MNKRIGICLHLGNYNLFSEMKKYLHNVIKFTPLVDIYASYQVENSLLQELVKEFPGTQLVNSTYGMDIGGQLLNLNNLFRSGKNYSAVLFLHTKSRSGWRALLTASTCLFPETVSNCMSIFETEPRIGIIGSSYWRYNLQKANYNHETLLDYTSQWKFNYTRNDPNTYFIAGTIFWMRFSILDQFVKEKKIDFTEEYNRLEKIPGRVLNNRPTRIHAWERIFGIATTHYGYTVHGLPPVFYEKVVLPPDFNPAKYLEKNPDLRPVEGIPVDLLSYHYFLFGKMEGRPYK